MAGQLQSMVDDWREAEDRWGKDLAALRDQLHSKDLELEKTFTLASDLNKQRGACVCSERCRRCCC